jgi:hypothetical protein
LSPPQSSKIDVDVLENPRDDEGRLDAGDAAPPAAAALAGLDLEGENPLEALRPRQGSLPVGGPCLAALVGSGGVPCRCAERREFGCRIGADTTLGAADDGSTWIRIALRRCTQRPAADWCFCYLYSKEKPMPFVNEIHVVVDVEDDRYVGTNDALTLTVSGGGADLFVGSWTGSNTLGNGQTVPQNRTGAALVPLDTDTRRGLAKNSNPVARDDLWSAISYYIFQDENPYAFGFDTAQLDPSSIRLGILGSDLLYPRHIVVWGLADLRLANYQDAPATVRTPVPLGLALNVNRRLSNTYSEGPQSMLIPRVAPWARSDAAGGERRVDQVILTLGIGSTESAAASSSATQMMFRIFSADGTLLCSQVLPEAQLLRPGEWKSWLLPVTRPFTWSEVMPVPPPPQPCRLRIDGGDSIRVSRIFVFGIDSTTNPPAMLPLVHWSGNEILIGGALLPERLLVTANHDVSEVSQQSNPSLGGVATSDPDVALNAPGGLVVFVRGTDNALWHRWQERPDGDWSPWTSLEGICTSGPAAALYRDGRLNVFVRGTDNAIWWKRQTSPNGDWSFWVRIGGDNLTSDPAATLNLPGGLVVFARGSDNAIWHTWQDQTDGAWSAWESLGGNWTSGPGAALYRDGRLTVFARGTDGAVWTRWQTTPNGNWTGTWESLGGVVTSDPVATLNAPGGLAVFARGTDNAIWHTWQDQLDGGWNGWKSLGGNWSSGPAATTIAMAGSTFSRGALTMRSGVSEWSLLMTQPLSMITLEQTIVDSGYLSS